MSLIFSLLIFCLCLVGCKTNTIDSFEKNKLLYKDIAGQLLPGQVMCDKFDTTSLLTIDLKRQIMLTRDNFSRSFPGMSVDYQDIIYKMAESKATNNAKISVYCRCFSFQREIIFSTPIYNEKHDLSAVCTKLVCGRDCGETNLLLLKKTSGGWKIAAVENLSVQ